MNKRSKSAQEGTLVNFTYIKRVNTKGIENANKHELMASLTYNLKKYLSLKTKKPLEIAKVISQKRKMLCGFTKWLFFDSKKGVLRLSYFLKPHAILRTSVL